MRLVYLLIVTVWHVFFKSISDIDSETDSAQYESGSEEIIKTLRNHLAMALKYAQRAKAKVKREKAALLKKGKVIVRTLSLVFTEDQLRTLGRHRKSRGVRWSNDTVDLFHSCPVFHSSDPSTQLKCSFNGSQGSLGQCRYFRTSKLFFSFHGLFILIVQILTHVHFVTFVLPFIQIWPVFWPGI